MNQMIRITSVSLEALITLFRCSIRICWRYGNFVLRWSGRQTISRRMQNVFCASRKIVNLNSVHRDFPLLWNVYYTHEKHWKVPSNISLLFLLITLSSEFWLCVYVCVYSCYFIRSVCSKCFCFAKRKCNVDSIPGWNNNARKRWIRSIFFSIEFF